MSDSERRRGATIRILSLVAIGFGLLTIRQGGAVLFGDAAARADAGHYVPFVVWFNFVGGFAYLAAGVGLWALQRWAVTLSAVLAVATALAFIAFGVHVYTGGAYEQRTVVAMGLRTAVWVAIAIAARRSLGPRRA